MKKVCIVSLGCSKNLVDSERISGVLEEGGAVIVDKPSEADVIVVNTCGFIKDAKEEAIETIFDFVDGNKKLIVVGCLVERYKEILKKEIPEIDALFGAESWKEVGEFLGIKTEGYPKRRLLTPSSYGYLKISEGCNRLCSFCAIPFIRGRYRSFRIEDIERELDILEESGVKEINIVSQDTTYYGRDISENLDIMDVIRLVEKRKGIKWIRLLYLYPSDVTEDLLRFIADSEKVVPYLDIPIQHISDKVLKHMRRGYGKRDIYNLLERISKILPNAVLRTAFIVGYPAEDERDFEELKRFVEEGYFHWVHAFTYSPEEGTKAYDYGDTVPEREKLRRQKEILNIQEYITEKKFREFIGKRVETLVDEKGIGRGYMHAPEIDGCIYIKDGDELKQGDMIEVIIEDTIGIDMVGARYGKE